MKSEKLLVGTRAFILAEDLDLYSIETGELNKLDKFTFVEIVVCDRLPKTRRSQVTKRLFTTYKVAPTSSEEAKKISSVFGENLQDDWDKPFTYEGPIACTINQLLEIIEDEFVQLKELYSKMVVLTLGYLGGPKDVEERGLTVYVHGHGKTKLAEAVKLLTPEFIEGNMTDRTAMDLVSAVKELSSFWSNKNNETIC